MGGQFTAGMLLAFQGLLSAFMAPVNSLVNLGQTIQETRTEMERVQDVLNYKADVPEGPEDSSETSVQAMGKLTGAIDVKDLTFGYSPLEKPIIENLNLHAEPGQWIALVGGSGSGKSTLLRLLLGFEKPDRGAIYFGGQDINDLDAQTPPGDCRSCYDVLADRIVMLDKGCIIEEGTYDELVAANGEFAELVRRLKRAGMSRAVS